MMSSTYDSKLDKMPFKGRIGIGYEDITPPVGIYSKNWGASKRETATGIHYPLLLHCVTFQSLEGGEPLVLLSADLGWWKNMEDEHYVRDHILSALKLDPANLMFSLTHSHSGPSLSRDDKEKAGGNLIAAYLDELRTIAVVLITKCLNTGEEAILTWKYGKCDLAKNRDLPDSFDNRYLVGYNQEREADDTLLLGRITGKESKILATIVNYACHPTTLAWDNELLSPDYIGALRETMVSLTGAPCIFLQGASGELAPEEQYVGEVNLPDRYGRQLAYACMATLESMLPAEKVLSFKKTVESGAPLAIWEQTDIIASTTISAKMVDVHMDVKFLPSIQEIEREMEEAKDPVIKERLKRKLGVRKSIGEANLAKIPLWIWRLGDSLLLAQPNEAYSFFQKAVRASCPGTAIAVMNVVNGHIGYLPPEDLYKENVYAVWQSPFKAGSLEALTKIAVREAALIFENKS